MTALVLTLLLGRHQVTGDGSRFRFRLSLQPGAVHLLRDTLWQSLDDTPKDPKAVIALRKIEIKTVQGDTAKVSFRSLTKGDDGKYTEVAKSDLDLKANGEPFFDNPILAYWDYAIGPDREVSRSITLGEGLKIGVTYTGAGKITEYAKRPAIKIEAKMRGQEDTEADGTQVNWIDPVDGWLIFQETNIKITLKGGHRLKIHSQLEQLDPKTEKIEMR